MPNGRAPAVGERFTNPGLARAYELIANGGRAAFYDGPIAAALEDSVRGNGGYLGREDLAAHRSSGSSPWQRRIAAGASSSCRRTVKASPCCKC